jgi:hypothetical protein
VSGRVTLGYAALMALLGATVLAKPSRASPTWAAIGMRGHRPSRRAPCWLLAGAILAMMAGDVAYGDGHIGAIRTRLSDLCYLAMFPARPARWHC